MPGLLPFSRASAMMDVVALAMVVVLPVLAWSILQARRGRYRRHKRTQIATVAALGVVVIAFEIDVRLGDWRSAAAPSRFYDSLVWPILAVHLVFAIGAAVLTVATLAAALRRFPVPPRPDAHSRTHRRLGWASTIALAGTAVTGWAFYVVAFVL